VFLSVFLIWGLLIWLNIEAVDRMINPQEKIDGNIMLGTSIFGLMCNILNIFVLNADELDLPCCRKKKEENEDEEEVDQPADTEIATIKKNRVSDL
jgi:Co/Zn/Cd efflux system component